MSKLAALAAKRRKEKELQKSSSGESPVDSTDYTERLRQLQVTQSARTTKAPVDTEEQSIAGDSKEAADSADRAKDSENLQEDLPEAGLVQHLRRPPSAFATVLTHPSDDATIAADALQPIADLSTRSTFDFSQPSPDDVFRRAQGSK